MNQWPSATKTIRSSGSNGAGLQRLGTVIDDEAERRLHQMLIQELDESTLRGLDRDQVREQVERAARSLALNFLPLLVGDAKELAVNNVVDEVTGLGPIEPLLRDPTVSEVMVNAPDEVYYECNGVIHKSDLVFRDEAHVFRIIERIVSLVGRHVDEASPMVDARLQDGSRVNVVIPPLAPKCPVITIRKFRNLRYSMAELVEIGTLSEQIALFIEGCVRAKLNIVISGGTGTGKTTLLNSLSTFMPEGERVITVEDPIELRLHQKHVIQLEARRPSIEGTGEVTQRDLVRNALRMRPDRIIVGEVRGAEAFDMMQAMNTGHEGSITTVHANSPRDALARVENMVLMAGFDMPTRVIREQMASALHVVIQLSRLLDGSRKVVQVAEVSGMEGSLVTLQDIFVYRQTGITANGTVTGQVRATGIRPKLTDRIKSFGVDLPGEIFDVGRWG